MARSSLFNDIISRISKSVGGGKGAGAKGKPKEPADDEDEEDEEDGETGDDEELVEATEVIKALADQIQELRDGQEELLEALRQDEEFKKSLGEGMVALMRGYETLAKTPLPRKGVGPMEAAGMSKGGLAGAQVKRHRQFTPEDKDQALDVLTKAVASEELTLMDCSKIETQINKSMRDPYFQLDPRYIAFLEKKLGA